MGLPPDSPVKIRARYGVEGPGSQDGGSGHPGQRDLNFAAAAGVIPDMVGIDGDAPTPLDLKQRWRPRPPFFPDSCRIGRRSTVVFQKAI